MPIENNDRDEKTVSSSKLMVNFLPRFQVGNYPFFTYFNKKKQALTEPDKQLEENLPPSLKKNRSLVQITRFERIASIQSSTEQRKASIADIIDEVISFSNSGKNLEKTSERRVYSLSHPCAVCRRR